MSVNNRLIIKNSIALYVRMLLSMVISLYTTRVVLNVLGANDFGLYSVIAGIITIFAVLNGLVASGTQRFIAFELGRGGDKQRLKDVFSTSYSLFLVVGIVIFILSETVGLWFVNTYIQIPIGREFAANVVYQVSVLQMFVSIVNVPFTAAILAHERMNIYGYIGIVQPLIRLGFIIILPFIPWDKLIIYSIMMFATSALTTIFYVYYCNKTFYECSLRFYIHPTMKGEILSFTAWNLLEVVSNESNNQGQNILINMFFGPIVNASRAVSMQVNNAVHGFASNFVIALNPQITKSYAGGDMGNFFSLIIRGAKFAYIVLSIIMIPIIVNIDYILKLWLDNPPENANIFCELILVSMIIRMLSEPLYTGIQSTGKIKRYQIATNILTLFNLPICYVLFKIGLPAYYACAVSILMSVLLVCSRMYFIHKLTDFPTSKFVGNIIIRCVLVSILSLLVTYYINSLHEESFIWLITVSILSILISTLFFILLSLTDGERRFIFGMVRVKFKLS